MNERCTRPGTPLTDLAGYLRAEHASPQAAMLERLAVINDFSAVALSLPALAASELRQIGAGTAVPGAPMAVLGPGAGLGVSGLVPVAHGNFAPIPGEGGRVTLSAGDERETAACTLSGHEAGALTQSRARRMSASNAAARPQGWRASR